jgi:hypothetical protein
MRLISTFLVALFTTSLSAYADGKSYDAFCDLAGYPPALRETHIVVDSLLVTPEPGPPLEENKGWRQRVYELLDADDQGALKRWAARERITVSIAEADGSGLKEIFSGCMPLYSSDEQRQLSEKNSSIDTFLGRSWRDNLEKSVKAFRRSVTVSMVQAAKDVKAPKKGQPFITSGLGQSLARGYRPTYQYGTPRLVVLTDLSAYEFPEGDTKNLRAKGRKDASVWAADFGRSEVHVLGASGTIDSAQKEHMKALFLADKGNVLTIAGLQGALLAVAPPVDVKVYQGTVKFPDGDYPVTLRLALDANRRAVNSWMEVQSDQLRFVPLEGALSCVDQEVCTFLETGDFAQVWTDQPQGDPEFENWMPFVGFRDMKFELKDGRITGIITDSSGYVPGMEEGLPFTLIRVENGAF